MTDEETWRRARTLEDLGELTAQWLEGKLALYPPVCGPPEEETKDLVPILAKFNRNGFMTHFSQPGEEVDEWVQRATVIGICSQDVAERLQTVTLKSELIVLAQHFIDDCSVQIPISLDGEKINTVGYFGDDPVSELRFWGRFVHRDLIEAMLYAWEVMVVDPRWARNDLLWDRVAHALQAPGITLEWIDHGGQ